MSRIGNKPIPVPAKVKVEISAAAIRVEGPKGKLEVALPRGVPSEGQGENLVALRDGGQWRGFHGLARALVANAVSGVDRGFKKEMDIVGVGYRAEVKGLPDSSELWSRIDARREAGSIVKSLPLVG